MAHDHQQILEAIRRSREVIVGEDGTIEDAALAEENMEAEIAAGQTPRARTMLKPDVFGAGGREVRVDARVLDAMHAEAALFPGETGGVLVGPHDSVVTELIPSGPSAHRTDASYQLDVEYLQPRLAAAEERGLRFLGIWHVHPEGVSRLSATDLRAAKRMLADPDMGVDTLLLPLTVRQSDGFETRVFRVSKGSQAVETPPVVVVSARPADGAARTAPSVGVATAADAQPTLEALSAGARIVRDIDALEADGWEATVSLGGRETTLDLARGDVRIEVILPPEYPLSPPDIVVPRGGFLTPHGGPFALSRAALAETDRWSSLRSLPIVVREAAAEVERLRVADARERRCAGRRLRHFFQGLRSFFTRTPEVRDGRFPFASSAAV